MSAASDPVLAHRYTRSIRPSGELGLIQAAPFESWLAARGGAGPSALLQVAEPA